MACTGQCCVAFPLSVSFDRLPTSLVDLLEPISQDEARERHARLFPGAVYELTGGPSDGQYYRCVHWDEETRLCGIYEERPDMCRFYPGYRDGAACEYGCDCADRRDDG